MKRGIIIIIIIFALVFLGACSNENESGESEQGAATLLKEIDQLEAVIRELKVENGKLKIENDRLNKELDLRQ
ncbi:MULTISPECIES: hypothetical protein [Bacillaceae]|uniref:BZIP transcription factor n=1 Tax=Evansella alkalicola TaxID=745819 RepID=A0ABS6JXB1_9BACI|nr:MULTISPECIES: hypothetical protein [Bacillaceae]MBU9723227.1 hypothetical protein [Bacillus alkalicola]